MVRKVLIAFVAIAVSGVACAEERPFCVDRPGKGTPSCVLDPGRFQVELGGIDAAYSRGGGTSVDEEAFGDIMLRLGLSSRVEGMVAWTPHVRVRTEDRASRDVSRVSGASDLTLALRWSLRNPGGDGVSIAVHPFVVAPTGADEIGDGAWQGGVIVPVSVALPADWTLSLSPEVDARPNASGRGRHAGYAFAGGVARNWGPVNLGAEIWVDVDDDPARHMTQASLDFTAAWTPRALRDVQFDTSAYVGVDDDAPDLQVVVGVAHRF